MREHDTVFVCDWLLLHKKGLPVVTQGQALAVRDGRISYIGPPSDKLTARKTWRLKNHLICPGFVNTHTHLPMSLFRGLADNLPLKTWLEDYILPLENALLNEDFVKTGTALSLIELVRSGVTTCCDMYFYNRALAKALDESGLRGIVGLGVPNPEKDGKKWREKTLKLSSDFKEHPRIVPGIAPHAPYTLDPSALKSVGQFAREQDLPLMIHVAESLWEKQEIEKKHGKSPVRLLHDLGLTGERSLFVHCVHVDDKDLDIMANSQTSFSYNPSSNMKLGNGIASVGTALEKGVATGLGTDGSASNNNLNFFKEMATGAKLQALKYGDASLTASQMLNMATLQGAKALGMDNEIGSLEEGKRADIIAIDLGRVSFQPFYDPISSLVYSSVGDEVSFVMCEGQVLMEKQELKTLDEEKIFHEAKSFAGQAKSFLSSI